MTPEYRNYFIFEVQPSFDSQKIRLSGRISHLRDHGGIIFAHLSDITGEIQIRFDPENFPDLDIKLEDWISVEGFLQGRPEDKENPKICLPEHELIAEKYHIYSRTKDRASLPVLSGDISEEQQLKYRPYVLRSKYLQKNLKARAIILAAIRIYLNKNFFTEIETPILAAPTPEGARDFVVPSRIHHGKFYALPQSPQIYKQLLMIAGFDRYFQIARCFRDEDLRANRQPEFTQIDLEMSFVTKENVMETVTGVVTAAIKSVASNILWPEAKHTFTTMMYDECLKKYGTDKPDLRIHNEIVNLTDIFSNTSFKIFRDIIEKGGVVLGIPVKNEDRLGRNEIDRLREWTKRINIPQPAWGDKINNCFQSTIGKYFNDYEIQALSDLLEENGQLFFLANPDPKIGLRDIGILRTSIGERSKRYKQRQYKWVWVTDFPAFELDSTEVLTPIHHPFTQLDLPKKPGDSIQDWLKYRSTAYDLVLNGEELGSGSIRIHELDKQLLVFKMLGYEKDEAYTTFNQLLESLEIGAPPHGGFALGFDRFVGMLMGSSSLREVIAFPKDGVGRCLLSLSPREVSEIQLKELSLKVELSGE